MDQGADRSSGTQALDTLALAVERLAGASSILEQTVSRLEEQHSAMSGQVQKIVATVEQGANLPLEMRGERIFELERKLHEAELQIAELRGQAGRQTGSTGAAGGRKTMTAATVSLLAKQGISNLDSIEAGSLDAALGALSIEQRIAVKSQLLRAGLLG